MRLHRASENRNTSSIAASKLSATEAEHETTAVATLWSGSDLATVTRLLRKTHAFGVAAMLEIVVRFAEIRLQRIRRLKACKLHSDAVIEMTDDLTVHRTQHHLNADCGFDVDLYRRA